jgi:hypothetical protein
MDIKTKYNFKDFVIPICTRREKIKVPKNCSVCKDEGKVDLNGKKYTCPECYGYTYHYEEGELEWYILENNSGFIGRINVEFYDNQYIVEDGRENEISYMLDSTGVGTGTLWREDCLFRSFQEAQDECDKRNNERRKSINNNYIIERRG